MLFFPWYKTKIFYSKNFSKSEDLPWETDPELREMTAVELRAILAEDLTEYQKAKLNSMCVQELEKELKTKTAAESSHIWEISNLQKVSSFFFVFFSWNQSIKGIVSETVQI